MIVLTLILVILIFEPEKSGITRAAAAKSVALALLSPEELNAWEKTYGASRFAADEVGDGMFPIWIICMKITIWTKQKLRPTGNMPKDF